MKNKMIRQLYMFTLKNKEKDKMEFLKTAENLRKTDGIKRVEIVENAEKAPCDYDIALMLDFDNREKLEAYETSQIYSKLEMFAQKIERVKIRLLSY